MTDDSKNKYKLFRNYMTNELGITKEDIQQWTMDAIQKEVAKQLKGRDLGDLANDAIRKEAHKAVWGTGFANQGKDLRECVAKELASQLQIGFKQK